MVLREVDGFKKPSLSERLSLGLGHLDHGLVSPTWERPQNVGAISDFFSHIYK